MFNAIQNILLISAFVINIILVILILSKKPRKKANIAFIFLLLSIILWNLTRIITDIYYDYFDALWWSRMAIVGVLFLPALFVYFVLLFPYEREKIKKKYIALLFLPAFVQFLLVPTSWNVEKVVLKSWGVDFYPGPLYIFFSIYFLSYVFLGCYILYKKYSTSKSKIEKTQIKYLIFGAVVSSLIGIIASAVLPLLGYGRIYMVGAYVSLIFTLSVTYVILRYRFLNIKLAAKKAGVFIFSLILAAIVYGALFIFLDRYILSQILFSDYTKLFLAIIIIIATWPLLKNVNEKIGKKIFSFKLRRQWTIVDLFNGKEMRNLSLANLLKMAAEGIEKGTGTSKVIFLICDAPITQYREEHPENSILLKGDDPLASYLKRKKEIVILDEVSYLIKLPETKNKNTLLKVESTMQKMGASLVMPFFIPQEDVIMALLVLHTKKNNKIYNINDIKFLEKYSIELTFALANTIMYEMALRRAGITKEKMDELYGRK